MPSGEPFCAPAIEDDEKRDMTTLPNRNKAPKFVFRMME
jgi:hypothetical protein